MTFLVSDFQVARDYYGQYLGFDEAFAYSSDANGWHRKSKGAFLSERRISKRIHHAGIYAAKIIDNDPFYTGVLGFRELVRYPEDKSVTPTILYLGIPDCVENIEHYSPNDENVSHPCFLVNDMQETIYTLKERRGGGMVGKPVIGKGKRWIMNMSNSDNTRVEFTEAYCVK